MKRHTTADPLDIPLLPWSECDLFTVRDLLNGGVSVLGAPGAAKTSGSSAHLRDAILNLKHAGLNSTVLALAAKPEDVGDWRGACEQAGRAGDFRVFGPGHPLKLNPTDYLMQRGATPREVAHLFKAVGETQQAGNARGGENSDFFESQELRLHEQTFTVLWLADRSIAMPAVQLFVNGRALNPEMRRNEHWLAGPHYQALVRAERAPKTPAEAHDFKNAAAYFCLELPALDLKTSSSIVTGAMTAVNTMCGSVVYDLMGGETNFELMKPGSVTVVDAPPPYFGNAGYVLNTWVKVLAQWEVLRRRWGPQDGIHVLWCDEAHLTVTSRDLPYLAMSRSHGGCSVYISQSLPSYFEKMGSGPRAEHQAHALIGCFGTSIFHALACVKTAEYAQQKCGMGTRIRYSGGFGPVQSVADELFGAGSYHGGFAQHFEPLMPAAAFMHGLRTGGPQNDFLADCVVVKSGVPFAASGRNFLRVTFRQR